MKHGFMLIELIVATLIASMVAGILLAALTQSNRFQMVIDNLVDNSVRVAVVSNQLEKDLMGSFIPVQAQEDIDAGKGEQPKEPADKKEPAKKNDTVDEKATEKEKPKPIKKIFYSTNKDGKFDTLTFITNNPLVVYVGKDVGEVKPKVVRVQYSLKAEADKKDSYALFRQESMELDLEKYKNVREYEVIGGIKNCTISFTARISSSAEATKDSAKASETSKVTYEYKTLTEWVSEQPQETDKEKSPFPRIPYSVEMKLALWDKQDKKEKDYTIICHIPTDFSPPKKEEKKQPEQPKKDETVATPVDKNKQQARNNQQPKGQEVVVFNGIETMSGTLEDLKKIFGQR